MKKYLFFCLALAVFAALLQRQPPVCTVQDGGLIRLYEGSQTQTEAILRDMGIMLRPGDGWEELSLGGARRIRLCRVQRITLDRDGRLIQLTSYGETVGALLTRCKEEPALSQRLCCDRALPTFDGMVICIRSEVPQDVPKVRTLPPEEQRYFTASLAPGEQRVLCPGSPGLEQTGGAAQTCLVRSKHDRVVLVGANCGLEVHQEPGTRVVTLGGRTLHYTQVLHVEATAYTCGSQPGLTAIGTTARVGAIAVDPKLIPYGTRMYILSDDGAYVYGYATAEDCGAFTGHHIDLYFNTEAECWRFGRRACTVYVLA